jgi:hypothetical protein
MHADEAAAHGPKVVTGSLNAPGSRGRDAGGSASKSLGIKKQSVEGAKDEEMLDDLQGVRVKQRGKERQPLFDRDTYYPTVVPFTPVDVPHDPNAAAGEPAIAPDLSEEVRACVRACVMCREHSVMRMHELRSVHLVHLLCRLHSSWCSMV